jgi:hypothetical protein
MRENPKVKKVVDEAHLFDGLKENTGWRRLYERVLGHEKRWMEGIASRLMRGEKIESSEIDFRRGFYQGARYVVEHPAQAEAALEMAAQEAWKMVRREAALQQEQDSPYLIRDIPQEGE